jgi:hypothetical protein
MTTALKVNLVVLVFKDGAMKKWRMPRVLYLSSRWK